MPSSPGLRPVLSERRPSRSRVQNQKRCLDFCVAFVWLIGRAEPVSIPGVRFHRAYCSDSLNLVQESDLIVRQLAEIVRRQRIVLEFVLCLRPKSAVISIKDGPRVSFYG